MYVYCMWKIKIQMFISLICQFIVFEKVKKLTIFLWLSRNILCIGTPSIHEAAQAHPDFNSLLLDYDTRHSMFHPPTKYLWYNMFNNYLFNGNDDEKVLKKFFKSSK